MRARHAATTCRLSEEDAEREKQRRGHGACASAAQKYAYMAARRWQAQQQCAVRRACGGGKRCALRRDEESYLPMSRPEVMMSFYAALPTVTRGYAR